MMVLLLGQQRIPGTRSNGASRHLRHDLAFYPITVDQTTIRRLLPHDDLQLTGLFGGLPALDQLRSGGIQVLEHHEQLIQQGAQHVEQQYQGDGDDVEIALVHRRLRALQKAVVAVMVVVVAVAGAVADRRRGLVAVLALGHAQLLRRLGAEFTGRTRAIAARHFPGMRFRATFAGLRCSRMPSTVVVLASGRADIPDTGGESRSRGVERGRGLHCYRGSRTREDGGGGGRNAAESRVARLTGYLLDERTTRRERGGVDLTRLSREATTDEGTRASVQLEHRLF